MSDSTSAFHLRTELVSGCFNQKLISQLLSEQDVKAKGF